MVGNAGVSANRYFFWVKIVLIIIIYNQAYGLFKWPLLTILIYVSILIPFKEIKRQPVRKLKRVKDVMQPDKDKLKFSDMNFAAVGGQNISAEIQEIVDLIVNEFVVSWFQKIDSNPQSRFPKIVKTNILQSISKLHEYLSKVDEADLIVLKLLPILTKYFQSFCTAKETVLNGEITYDKNCVSNINLQIAVEFNKINKLHGSLSLRVSCQTQDIVKHVNKRVEEILPFLINESELSSPFISILLKELIASCVIAPSILKFSTPGNWNSLIISISEKILEEHDQVLEVRKALSKEIEFHRNQSMLCKDRDDLMRFQLDLSSEFTEKQFDDYLRQISLLESAYHLKAVRHLLLSKVLILEDKQLPPKEFHEQDARASLCWKLIQTRLQYVNSKNDSSLPTNHYQTFSDNLNLKQGLKRFKDSLQTLSFDDILAEQMCFSYFKGFLWSHPNQYGISYLRFYELVEKMKTPLEDSGDITLTLPQSQVDDLTGMIEGFGSLDDLEALDHGLVSNIQLFVSDCNPHEDQTVILVRRSMLLLQNEAKKALSDDFFEDFKESKQSHKMLSDLDFIGTDIYSKLADISDDQAPNKPDMKIRSEKIMPRPYINDALDNILRVRKKAQRRSESSHVIGRVLFGSEDVENVVLEGSLFDDIVTSETNEAENADMDTSDEDSYSEGGSSGVPVSDKTSGVFVNLQLEIANLTVDIDQIEKELNLLDHLILKADLTNNQIKLKLLKKSKRALLRDLKTKELLRQRFLVQEDSNSLFKKTRISIKSYYVDHRLKSHREVIYYLINVSHICNGVITSWEIPRRFSEFFALNMELRKKYEHLVKHLQRKDIFPEKIKMSLKYHVSKSLLYEERKVKLEKYMRELLSIPEICQDNIFRRFLTNSARFTHEIDFDGDQNDPSDMEGSIPSLNPSLDCIKGISTIGLQTRKVDPYEDKAMDFGEDERLFSSYNDSMSYQNKSYVKSICDFFISVFSLKKDNSGWLKGRAILTLLQQLLGTAIDKYIKENLKRLTSESQLVGALHDLKCKLQARNKDTALNAQSTEPRTTGEQRAKLESRLLLQRLFSEVCGKVVGYRNAQNAAVNIHDMLQNPYLTASLLLEILDLVSHDVFLKENNS